MPGQASAIVRRPRTMWHGPSLVHLVELDDERRVAREVAVANPGRPHAYVRDAGPRESCAPVGVCGEIHLAYALELGAGRKVRDTFELRRDLVVPADHERDARIGA